MTNVLLIYEMLIPSVRLCAYEQLNYLMATRKINFSHSNINKVTNKMCMEADIVFFVRGASLLEEKLANLFKKQHKLLVYVLDDDLLNVPDGFSSSDYYRSDVVRNRIIRIMDKCDILLTPSINLATKYKDLFLKNIIIEEPAITYQISEKNCNKNIKIGFAGSIDRAGDIDSIISDAIRILIKKYGKKIAFEFMGAKPKVVDEFNLVHYEYENNYVDYKKNLEKVGWDIGLAPMPNTEFHQCKHYNKYIEYSSASIAGVYSNVEPYTWVISNRINGVLADNNIESWVESISWLIDQEIEIQNITHNASNDINHNFTISAVSNKLLNDLPELSQYKAKITTVFPLQKIKFYSFISKIFEFIKKYKFKSPLLIIKKIWTSVK